MLREIDTGIWAAEAPQRFLGADVGTRMTVIRLADGSLFVHSPIHLDDEIRASVDRLGPVRHVVAPNRYHHLYVADCQRNYHNDKQKAVELGFPEIVVQGMLSVCLVAEMMTKRFGLGFLYGGKMDLRLVNVVWGNDVTGPKGLIVERHPEGKRTRAEVEVWCDKADGAKTIVGSASALEL
jgi:hypothetical protein